MLLDRGRWKDGMAAMVDLLDLSEGVTEDTARRTRLMQFSLRAFAPDEALDHELQSYLTSQTPLDRRPFPRDPDQRHLLGVDGGRDRDRKRQSGARPAGAGAGAEAGARYSASRP